MALPFDRLNPADRQMLDSLKAQTENLRGQTRVLHSLSEEIIKLRKDTNSASSKTAKDFQNLFGAMTGGFSEIKSYLRGGAGASTSSMPDKGFFSNLFSKAFGPSKYEAKMAEELSAIRNSLNSRNKGQSSEYESKMLEELRAIRNALRSGGAAKERATATTFSKDKGAQPDRGFFSNLFNKVFGPSKYQTKMMDEITILRELSERQTRHLEFIAEQNTDSKRAKEREALATSIVNKMKMLDFGGDGGGIGGSLLSTLGKALLGGIAGAIALLGRQISTALRGLLAGLKLALKGLEKLLSDLIKLFPPRVPTPMPGPGQGPVPSPGGVPPVIVTPPGQPETNRLPNEQKRLPSPQGQQVLIDKDGKIIREIPRQTPQGRPTFNPGGGGRAIALALVALGAALGFKIMLGDEEKPGPLPLGGKSVMDTDSDPTRQLLDNVHQQIEIKRHLKEGGKVNDNLGDALRIAQKDKYFTDPFSGQQITAEQFKKLYSDKLKPEEKKELDKYIENQKLEEEKQKKQRLKIEEEEKKELEKLEKEQKGLDLQEDYNSIIQESIKALDGLKDAAVDAAAKLMPGEEEKKKAANLLNKLGEITIGGQTINLAPGLGDAMMKTLDDSIKLGGELADYTAEKLFSNKDANKGVTVNNNTNNNVNNSTSTLPPANAKRSAEDAPILKVLGF